MLPDKLKQGDTIGIVAPSKAVKEYKRELFNNAVSFFENLGFKIKSGEYIFNENTYSAGTPEERAQDINNMFRDNSVKAIFCVQGGDTANGTLPYLDYELIKSNPKVFMGLSDITVLLNAIYEKTGLVTFHGNDFIKEFGSDVAEYDVEELNKTLVKGETGLINSNGERKAVRDGFAEGRLIGGNLRCLLKLAGTEYFPEIKEDILFVEAYRVTPEQCNFMFEQLKQMGVFDKIKGVIVGYVYGLQHETPEAIQMEDVLLEVTKSYGFPILKCNDFGHCISNTVIPIGVKAKINTKDLSIELLEKSVS